MNQNHLSMRATPKTWRGYPKRLEDAIKRKLKSIKVKAGNGGLGDAHVCSLPCGAESLEANA